MSGVATTICGTCAFAAQSGQNTVCQRYPPAILPLAPGLPGAWPIIAANDWCGEWAASWPPSPPPSYSAAVSGFGNSAAGDVFSISGSDTMAVRVTILSVSGLCGANTMAPVSLVMRSALNTGGTPSTVTRVRNDGQNPAPTAVVTAYATQPSMGAAMGIVRAARLAVTNQSTMVATTPGTFFGANLIGQPITLRGANSCLCVLIPAINQAVWDIAVGWTESAQ